jgi:hypothetical protein
MICLEADDATFKALQGYCNSNGRFEFRELPDGRWIIHEGIVDAPDFTELVPQLSKLSKTTFVENND